MAARERTLATLGLTAAIAAPSAAQETIHEFVSTDRDGAYVVAGLGDVDGDSRPDFAIGRFTDGVKDRGAVDVRSGADGSLIYEATTAGSTIRGFGEPLRAIGDLDGDGISEIWVGAIDNAAQLNVAFVLSGADGHEILSNIPGAIFVEPAGDVDADGTPDWIASDGPYLQPTSIVEVRSGVDASVIHSIPGAGFVAPRVAGLGDVDGDGHDDFVVGDLEAPNSAGDPWAGTVVVHSGADASELRREEGAGPYSFLGDVVNRVGDVDGDGAPEYAVMDRTDDGTGIVHLRVCSSRTGAVVLDLSGDGGYEPLAYRAVDAGDVNGDGVPDLLTGPTVGSANPIPRVWSGRSGQLLYRFFGGGSDPYLGEIDTLGDVDGDGLSDLLVGEMKLDASFNVIEVVRVASGNDLWLSTDSRHPFADDLVTVTAREGVSGNLTVTVLIELGGVPMFQLVDGLGVFDATGTRAVADHVPPSLKGLDASLKSWAVDASGRLVESAIEVIEIR
jgi:hypothetical protein